MCGGMALTTRRSLSSGDVTEPFLGAKLPPAMGLGKREPVPPGDESEAACLILDS
jgi:hypothetical protein